jgi:nucleoid DNA-binding protein
LPIGSWRLLAAAREKPPILLAGGRLPMTKADVVSAIAGQTGLTKTDVSDVVEGLLASVIGALSRGERIEIRGFGTFKTVRRASRVARNPRKGEAVRIPARNLPVFQPSKELRSLVENSLPVKETR